MRNIQGFGHLFHRINVAGFFVLNLPNFAEASDSDDKLEVEGVAANVIGLRLAHEVLEDGVIVDNGLLGRVWVGRSDCWLFDNGSAFLELAGDLFGAGQQNLNLLRGLMEVSKRRLTSLG